MVKKVIPSFLAILCYFLTSAEISYAAPLVTAPTPTTNPNTITAPSGPPVGGPPIGVSCGNTRCLPGEVCTTYPGEEPKCVPNPLNAAPSTPPLCKPNMVSYPPNSYCYNPVKETQKDISLYKKTCIYEPVVNYSDKRYLSGGDQSCGKCGSDPANNCNGTPSDEECNVHVLANTDVRDAELGSYGPNQDTIASYSADFIAQQYIFNSLFDRPSDLSNTNREAYRTYWRLLPASNQANLRSFILNMAFNDKIDNTTFTYKDLSGNEKTTNLKEMYVKLKSKIIITTSFPPVPRVGCLVSYPVCPEFAQAMKELKYGGVLGVGANKELAAAYAAFIPLELDNLRGFIVLDAEEGRADAKQHLELVDLPNFPPKDGPLKSISKENLPYIGAIYQGLLSPKFGILSSLQPQWLIDSYTTKTPQISDYKMGIKPSETPEVAIAHKNFLKKIWEWISSFITKPDPQKGYILSSDEKQIEGAIYGAYESTQTCPLPVSYHLWSPKTIPATNGHYQIITIKGTDLTWAYAPECRAKEQKEVCSPSPTYPYQIVCSQTTEVCKIDAENYEDGDSCCRRAWNVSGTGKGKALTVLNNPKQTDIKDAIVSNDKFSLYNMLLPSFAIKTTDFQIDAPIAKNLIGNKGGAVAPGGSAGIVNPGEPIIRENNLAQDSMHLLQNCWTVPGDLQNSPRCSPGPIATSSACGPLLDFTPSDASCGLCQLNKIPGLIDDPMSSAFPEGVPEIFVQILQKAGESYGVPASLIFGTMYNEGAFSAGRYHYTDANIREWSKCGGEMPNCDKTQTSVAQTPFGFIPYWFYGGDGVGAVWNAIQAIDPGRTKDNTSPCNFADGVFATAKALRMWTYVRSPDFEKYYQSSGDNTCCQGGSCYKLANVTPGSCSQWTNDIAAQARIGFAGYCPEPGKHTIQSYFPDNAPFISRAISRFNALKCF